MFSTQYNLMQLKIFSPLIALLTFLLGLTAFTLIDSMKAARFEKTLEPVIVKPKENDAVENSSRLEDEKALINNVASDFDGYFYVIGQLSNEFKDFDYIEIEGNGYYIEESPLDYGAVITTNEKSPVYNLLKPTIKGRHISFKTETVSGLRYEFEGNLTDKYFSEKEMLINDIALIGILKKIKNGKTIAQSKLKFGYSVGC